MTDQNLLDEPAATGAPEAAAHCARLVLAVYTAVMASSRNSEAAFNAAVETYRSENPELPDAEKARRSVARIICHKP